MHSSLFLSSSPQLQMQVDHEPINNQRKWARGSAIKSTILRGAVGHFLSHSMGLINDHFKWDCWSGTVSLRLATDFLSQGYSLTNANGQRQQLSVQLCDEFVGYLRKWAGGSETTNGSAIMAYLERVGVYEGLVKYRYNRARGSSNTCAAMCPKIKV